MDSELDWKKFLTRKGLKNSEAARLIGAAPAMITEWIKGKSLPTYKYLKKLSDVGMTAQEMFGEEIGTKLVQNSAPSIPPELSNDPAFQKGLQQSIDAKVSAAVKAEIAALKSKGML